MYTGKTDFDHSYDRDLLPLPIVLRSEVNTRQLASACLRFSTSLYSLVRLFPGGYYTRASPYNFGNGTNNNTFDYQDDAGNTYYREVNAAYNNITLDIIEGTLASATPASRFGAQSDAEAVEGVFRLPGRT